MRRPYRPVPVLPPPPPPPDALAAAPPPPLPVKASADVAAAGAHRGWVTLGTGETVDLASPARRLGARLVDGGIVSSGIFWMMAAAAFVALAVADAPTVEAERAVAVKGAMAGFLLGLPSAMLYEIGMIAVRGQTVGKSALGIQVVRFDTGLVPGWGQAAGRCGVPAGLVLVPFVGLLLGPLAYLSLLWDGRRRGWHDRAAGTLVIEVDEPRR